MAYSTEQVRICHPPQPLTTPLTHTSYLLTHRRGELRRQEQNGFLTLYCLVYMSDALCVNIAT